MTVKDLEDAYDYSCWANRKLFEVISELTADDLEMARAYDGRMVRQRNYDCFDPW